LPANRQYYHGIQSYFRLTVQRQIQYNTASRKYLLLELP